MATRVISLRLPAAVHSALARSAVNATSSVSDGLELLLRHSFSNCQLLGQLADCSEFLDAKLDVRMPITTFEQLHSATEQVGIPISVYIRKLLYHLYITKRLVLVQSNGHYTLAGRHD